MKTGRKGSERERKTIKRLEGVGYHCTRAAGSLGVFDIVAACRLGTRYIQVKSNRWPSPEEREDMIAVLRSLPTNSTAECWRWDDNAREPLIKHVDEF